MPTAPAMNMRSRKNSLVPAQLHVSTRNDGDAPDRGNASDQTPRTLFRLEQLRTAARRGKDGGVATRALARLRWEADFASWYSSSTLTAQMFVRCTEDVLDGQDRGVHGVVLIVVLVHAVATDQMDVRSRGHRGT